jgi:hypothetical protein
VTSFAALVLAVAAVTAGADDGATAGRGVQLAGAQVEARIVRPAIVRQASGLQRDEDGPIPQLSRRGRTVLVEFE